MRQTTEYKCTSSKMVSHIFYEIYLLRKATSKIKTRFWTRNMDPDPEKLGPEKPGPRKTVNTDKEIAECRKSVII